MFCQLGLFFFFLSLRACFVKGLSLRCSPGRGNAGRCAVVLYVGEGTRGSYGAWSTLHQVSVTPFATHSQIGPLWCCFQSGWACARPRPLWVCPTTSPVRLGVSPAAASTPTGVFSQRFESLFPHAGALGCGLLLSPPFVPVYLCANVGPRGATRRSFSATPTPALSVYLCVNVGPQGLLVVRLPALLVSHSASLSCQSGSRHSNWIPLCPGCPSPPHLPVWMNVHFFISLVSDFLAVGFSVSSCRARWHSVSTYAAMLVLS